MGPRGDIDAGAALKIAVTGATGLIGTALSARLSSAGHQVIQFVRERPTVGGAGIFWDPARGEIDAGSMEGLDAAVHLAGENIGEGRWTPERKARIMESRTSTTALLCRALAGLKTPPKVLVSASAVGFYGNRPGELLTEDSAPGEGFLAEVCRAWEGATVQAAEAGIRVARIRTGVVISGHGGALGRMLPSFKAGLGGVIGGGAQMMSWISLTDITRIIDHLILTPGLEGPVNACSPTPVSNREFTEALGRVLKRPALLPLPAFAVRMMFGEMGKALLLDGAAAVPEKLLRSGFTFTHPSIEDALRYELSRP